MIPPVSLECVCAIYEELSPGGGLAEEQLRRCAIFTIIEEDAR